MRAPLALAALCLSACQLVSGLDGLRGDGGGGGTGGGGAGGGGGGQGNQGGDAGQGGSGASSPGGAGGAGATGGSGGAAGFCGDGVIGPGEDCDGADLGGAACPLGSSGAVVCNGQCQLDASACLACFADAHCSDPSCAALCAGGTCGDPKGPTEALVSFQGTFAQGSNTFDSRCSFVDNGDATFEIVAPIDGVLTVALASSFQKLVSITTGCTTADTVVCADDDETATPEPTEVAWASVSQGDTRYVVLDTDNVNAGPYVLDAAVHPPVVEVEPNDEPSGNASLYGFPFVGSLVAGDQDVIAYTVTSGPNVLVRLMPLDAGDQCPNGDQLRVYQSFLGGNLQGQKGNGGSYNASQCRKVVLSAVPGDTLFLEVTALGGAPHAYGLLVREY